MKKILLFAVGILLMAYTPSIGQTIDEEITIVQQVFGQGKKALIEVSMDLPSSIAPSFWTVYDQYETARLSIARERIKIMSDYLTSYENLGEAEADALASRSLKNDLELTKLHATYYKKFRKETSALVAAKFLQIDTYIHNTIRNAMQQELPFIGEK
jgi:hypothetical protein